MLKPEGMTWDEWKEKHKDPVLRPEWMKWDEWTTLTKENLVYYDGPIVDAQVGILKVGRLNRKGALYQKEQVRFLLSYYSGEYADPESRSPSSPDGYIHIRWSEKDLETMLRMVRKEKSKLKKAKTQRKKEKRRMARENKRTY